MLAMRDAGVVALLAMRRTGVDWRRVARGMVFAGTTYYVDVYDPWCFDFGRGIHQMGPPGGFTQI